MATITFNHHLFVKKLIELGVKEDQAELIGDGLRESREIDFNQFVTKEYLDMKLKAEIAGLEIRLIFWMLGIGITGFASMTGILIAVIKFYLAKNGASL